MNPRADDAIDKATHRLIARATDEYERWSQQQSVAAFMEFTNDLFGTSRPTTARDRTRHGHRHLLLLMAPMAPHITAELWVRRHDDEHIHELPWPQADPAKLTFETVTMIVQVNGKAGDSSRSRPTSTPPKPSPALASEKVQSPRRRPQEGGRAAQTGEHRPQPRTTIP